MKQSENNRIDRLIKPRRIAVIGASNKEGKVGHIIFESLQKSRAEVFPVNPYEAQVLGCHSFAEPRDLPDGVDLAVITLQAESSVKASEECAVRGIPFIIVVAGGFSEIGEEGSIFEKRLQRVVEEYDTRIVGPNTLGVFVPEYKIDTIFVEHGDESLAGGGGITFITQSGSIGVESLGLAGNTGFGMRAFIGLGNKVDMDELDFLKYFGKDDATKCLAFYIESFEKGRDFLTEAQKISCRKPVIILKSGRTETGASAVSSHTGRLAGSDRVVSGAFRQFGIQRAFDDEELCDAAKTLSILPAPEGNKVAVVSPAGGFGVMCTDYIEGESSRSTLRMANLSRETVEGIREYTLEIASCQNPIDLTAAVNNEMYIKALELLIADRGVDIVVCITFFSPPGISDDLIFMISDSVKKSSKPVLIFSQYGPYTEQYLHRFYNLGVIGFPSINRVVRAARFLVERGKILGLFCEEDCR